MFLVAGCVVIWSTLQACHLCSDSPILMRWLVFLLEFTGVEETLFGWIKYLVPPFMWLHISSLILAWEGGVRGQCVLRGNVRFHLGRWFWEEMEVASWRKGAWPVLAAAITSTQQVGLEFVSEENSHIKIKAGLLILSGNTFTCRGFYNILVRGHTFPFRKTPHGSKEWSHVCLQSSRYSNGSQCGPHDDLL